MDDATWVCDACHTNNSRTSEVCRRCHRLAGSTTAIEVELRDRSKSSGPMTGRAPGAGSGSSSSTPPGRYGGDSRGRRKVLPSDGKTPSRVRISGTLASRDKDSPKEPVPAEGKVARPAPSPSALGPRKGEPAMRPGSSPMSPPPLTPDRRVPTGRYPAEVTARPPRGYGGIAGGVAPVPYGAGRPRRGYGRPIILFIAALAAVLVGLVWGPSVIHNWLSASPNTIASTICPASVAPALPGSGDNSRLVAAYMTSKFYITICSAESDQLYYDGQVIGMPPTADTHITLPAQRTQSGFIAKNGPYSYEVRGGHIVVSLNGSILLDDTLLVREAPS